MLYEHCARENDAFVGEFQLLCLIRQPTDVI